MKHNDKFATYLPGIYLAAAATCAAGFREYPRWLDAWFGITILFWGGIGALVFAHVYGSRRWLVAAVGTSALWLFNRWSLYVLLIAHTDFVAIFFLVLCVLLLPRRSRWAWLAFGVSLSIKHIGILALPVLLVAQWRTVAPARRRAELAWSLAAMAAVPLAVSLPFLLANPAAFVQSMLFSVTRGANIHMGLHAFVVPLGLKGAAARLPILLVVAAVTWVFARRQVGLNAAAFLILVAFVWFNSVFFRQYGAWPIPFALMAFFDRPHPEGAPPVLPTSPLGDPTPASTST
jgi:uncharacterized membrane protein